MQGPQNPFFTFICIFILFIWILFKEIQNKLNKITNKWCKAHGSMFQSQNWSKINLGAQDNHESCLEQD